MKKAQLTDMFKQFDLVHGVTYRAIAQLRDHELDARPVKEMRSVRELIAHIFGQEKAHARAVVTGKLTKAASQRAEAEGMKKKSAKALLAWARQCHRQATADARRVTDRHLARTVHCYYGKFSGGQIMSFLTDEHWHHRGQLYVFLRLLGKEPVFLYGYAG